MGVAVLPATSQGGCSNALSTSQSAPGAGEEMEVEELPELQDGVSEMEV